MQKLWLLLWILPMAVFAQEQKKDEDLDRLLAKVTKIYYRTKAPGYFVPEVSVAFRFEGNTLFSREGSKTIGGVTTMFDIKFWRYMGFGAIRFTVGTPFTPGGSHANSPINYYVNRAYRFGIGGGAGGTVFDNRSNETGKGSAVTLALWGFGELLADGDRSYSGGGMELNIRYLYSFHRYFSLTTGFDIGWKVFGADFLKRSANGIFYGLVLGMAF